eukprot:962300-Pyramimonas_sp.AAC.1
MSVAEMQSNAFRAKKAGFDVSKHITLKKGSDEVYMVVALSEMGLAAQHKLRGDLVGEKITAAWMQPPRRPWEHGGS